MILLDDSINTNYLDKYGILLENETLILLDEKKIDEKISKTKENYRKKMKKLKKQHDKALEKIEDFGKDVGEDVGKDTIDDLRKKIENKSKIVRSTYLARMAMMGKKEAEAIQRLQKIKSVSRNGLLITSGIALATIIITAGYKVFRDEQKRISMECSSKKGQEKTKCLKLNKIKSLRKRISFLNNAAIKCNYSKNPAKCKNQLDKEILRLKEVLRNETIDFGKKLKIEL